GELGLRSEANSLKAPGPAVERSDHPNPELSSVGQRPFYATFGDDSSYVKSTSSVLTMNVG
ncbi:MAG: hypothetical protein ACXWER_05150, partial [Halobacteriota archaeon]